MYYKSLDNKPYWIDDESEEKFLPFGSIKISDDEAADLLQSIKPPPPAVTRISPRQIRLALTQQNLRSQVEAAVAAGDQNLKDWWEYATYFDRNNEEVLAMATALNISSQQLDDLWALGASL